MDFIASVQAYTSGYDSSLEASSTLNILAGDVLVMITNPDAGTGSVTSMAEDDESNDLTLLDSSTSGRDMTIGYLLSAAASSAATMKVTLSGAANTAGWEFTCLQFRTAAGETVTFGSGPASNNSGWGVNPISGQLSTTSSDSLFVGGAFNANAALSNHLLGGSAPDGVITGTDDFDLGYSVFSTSQSNITYGASSGQGVWVAQMIGLDIEVSSGGSLLPINRNWENGFTGNVTRKCSFKRSLGGQL